LHSGGRARIGRREVTPNFDGEFAGRQPASTPIINSTARKAAARFTHRQYEERWPAASGVRLLFARHAERDIWSPR
jgi:hypothetical protein